MFINVLERFSAFVFKAEEYAAQGRMSDTWMGKKANQWDWCI
jgi:hypothetical protein